MKNKLISLCALFLLVSCGGSSSSLSSSSSSAQKPSTPASTSSAPATSSQDPVTPSSDPVIPSSDPIVPSSDPVVPSSDPVVPSSDPVIPSSDPVVPPSSDPASSSTDPSTSQSSDSSASQEPLKDYLFEAEYCPCIEDMEGATYSGGTSSYGLIGKDRDKDMDASGGYYVHFMYVQGSVLEFNIQSDRDVDDVTLICRFSAEYRDIEFDLDTFPIFINGDAPDYGTIKIEGVPLQGGGNKAFADFKIVEGAELKKGMNKIELKVDNNILMYGTALSTAPMTDCIKLKTSANLTWPEECPENLDQVG